MKAIIENLLRIKSIITLVLVGTLAFLTITNPAVAEYRTGFLTAVASVMAYYFAKKDSETPVKPVENSAEKEQK